MKRDKPDKKLLRNTVFALLNEGKTVKIKANGYSMYPAIRPMYTICIEAMKKEEELKVGEVIAWYRDNDLVSHRLIHIYSSDNKQYYITRGDSSPSSDLPLTIDKIAGRVVEIQSKRRSYSPQLKTIIPEWRYKLNRTLAWFIMRLHKIIRR